MVKTIRRRYVLFKAHAQSTLSRGEMVHWFNVHTSQLGLGEKERPWLMVFDQVSPDKNIYLGIFKVPHTVKDKVVEFLIKNSEKDGVKVTTIKVSGTIKTTKEYLQNHAAILKRSR